MNELNEVDFFYQLLKETEDEFKCSLTKKRYPNEKWGFAVCDTPIQKGKGILFGINWGDDSKLRQTAYPQSEKSFKGNRFIRRSQKYVRDHLKSEIKDLNYSNLCFFRTPFAKDLPPEDWKRAIPLFKKYVDYIDPPWMVMLGKPNKLKLNVKLEKIKEINQKSKKSAFAYHGVAFGEIPFISVPHPQARLSNEVRSSLWKKVTSTLELFPK